MADVSDTLKNMAQVMAFLDKVFDSVNGASTFSKKNKGKELRSTVTKTSIHHKFWQEGIEIFQKIKYIDKNSKELTVPSIRNWLVFSDNIIDGTTLMMMKNDDLPIDYEKSLGYWADIPATVDGVLGGFGHISDVDLQGSLYFLKTLLSLQNAPAKNRALDCGAGIGRISKHVLCPFFDVVDIIEPDDKFINSIRNFIGDGSKKVGNLYKVGLQEFIHEHQYDVIWNQWVLGYLTNEDLITYLVRCRNSLTENGVIIIKENVTSSGKEELDEVDSSVTRPYKQYLSIFKKANLKRIKQSKQTNFPSGIYPVYMFALIPDKKINDDGLNNVPTE